MNPDPLSALLPHYKPENLEALLRGIAAAPPSLDCEWSLLIAEPVNSELRILLTERIEELRATQLSNQIAYGKIRADRLSALRSCLREQKLDGFIVPRCDEHQNEFISAHAGRLAWLTGFTGSAGWAVILQQTAAIFIDGRYSLSVHHEVDTTLVTPRHMTEAPVRPWLAENLPKGARIGYDPWLHTRQGYNRFAEACQQAGGILVPVEMNPVDQIWSDQPPPPISLIQSHALTYSGENSAEKRKKIAKILQEKEMAATLVSAPDSLAWLFNIRGGDVGYTPLSLGFALLACDGSACLFTDPRKVTDKLHSWLGEGVHVLPLTEFGPALDQYVGQKIGLDSATASDWIVRRLEQSDAKPILGEDPCTLPKARKNAVELAGMSAAHLRDGVALTRFLHWLKTDPSVLKGNYGEAEAAAWLDRLRAEGAYFRGLSFPTIAGFGANGAIVHYRVTETSSIPLRAGGLFLVDSGGQYLDGTTDVTRTVGLGTPGAEEKEYFTLVLRGHIALAQALFPAGTTGGQLDILARLPLWQAGLDFDHGTGHGVGCYLGVHEGPQRISKISAGPALEEGMILSNEPGYYKAGSYGIRIENLVCVRWAEELGAEELGAEELGPKKLGAKKLGAKKSGSTASERPMLGFETLTLAPIDRDLIDFTLLTEAERAWLNAYHAKVRCRLAPHLNDEVLAWLVEVTNPL